MNWLKQDLVDGLRVRLGRIDGAYRRAFGICLACNAIVYSIFIFHYLMHNHGLRFPWVNPLDQYFAGRWAAVLFFGLTGFANIPVLQQLLAIALSAAAALLVISIWSDTTPSLRTATLVSLLMTLYPANLSAFYYTWQVNVFAGSMFLSALGLWIASSLNLVRVILGGVVLMLALATYQTSLSVAATVVMGLAVLVISRAGEKGYSLFICLRDTLLPRVMAILIGGVGYIISLRILGMRVGSVHSLETVSFSEFPDRCIQVVRESFAYLVYTQPDLLGVVKGLLLLTVVMAGLLLFKHTVKTGDFKYKILRATLFLLAFLVLVAATKAMYLLSNNNTFWQYRYNFALGFFYAFCMYVLLTRSVSIVVKNLGLLLAVSVVLLYAQADLVRQGVLLRGQLHDLALANRILYRMESLPDIDFSKEYYLVRVGAYPRIRINALQRGGHSFDKSGDFHMDTGEISAKWTPNSVMHMLGTKVKWKNDSKFMQNYEQIIKDARAVSLEQGRKPWPHASSVFIHRDRIIIYMN